MNKESLHQLFQHYIDRFAFLNNDEQEEYYKWQVCREFPVLMREALEADKAAFSKKLNEVRKSTYNIIDSYTQPFAGLVDLAREDLEATNVQEMLKDLYADDGGDINTQMQIIEDFFRRSNELVDKHFPESFRYRQNSHSVSALLFLNDPDRHYMFKASQCQRFADTVEFYDDWGVGDNIELDVFYRFCDEILEEINSDKSLLSTDASRYDEHFIHKSGDFHPDTEKHILLFDIIYCCSTYDLFDGVSYTRRNASEKKLYTANKQKANELKKDYEKAQKDDENLRDALSSISDMLKPGEAIMHKKHGLGKVTRANDTYVTASFADGDAEIGIAFGIANNLVSFESKDITDKCNEYMPLLKRHKLIPDKVEWAARALKPYEEYLD